LRELASANTKVHSLLRQIKGIVIDWIDRGIDNCSGAAAW
jgi:hypothetical protein